MSMVSLFSLAKSRTFLPNFNVFPLIHQIANEYKANLQNLYGDELAEVILFGSHARSDNRDESDLDFAVVLRNPNTRTTGEIAKISFIGSRLSLKYGRMISSLPVSLHKKQTSMQGIYQEIRKEGIII
jgi:predicted nucleotidyltransferase